MKFWKYQLNGNDFILIETKKRFTKEQIIKMCDAHFGIGADGLCILSQSHNRIHYKHYNVDGSKAGMCGNGIRCVGLWYMNKKQVNQCVIEINEHSYTLFRKDQLVSLIAPIPKIIKPNCYHSGVKHWISKDYQESREYNVDVVNYHNAMYFTLTTYELGVGYTHACGSGALAAYYHGYLYHGLADIACCESAGGINILRRHKSNIYLSGNPILVYYGYYNE
ncbi:MAG: hypothetical protein RR524_05275 [Erysipelotrichaceae bacterium]